MDPLSQLLVLLRPDTVGWRVIEAHDAFTLHLPPRPDAVVFGQMIACNCEVTRRDGVALRLAEGDFILMIAPPPWCMRAGTGGPELELKALLADPSRLKASAAPRRVTRFMAGYFTFLDACGDLLGRLLPPIIHVRADAVAATRMGLLLSLLGDEAAGERAGRSHALERLVELILVEALRQPGIGWAATGTGLLNGLADPVIARALRRMHEDLARDWTVAELASAAGMSRSAFAARFPRVVGLPPIDYLSSWRMTLARQALEAGERPLADVAELAGYRSVSAFSTAFRRLTGRSPTAHMRAVGAALDG